MALHAAPDDLALKYIEGGEQGGSTMALVIVGHCGTAPFFHRQTRLGAIEGLDLALLVEAEQRSRLRDQIIRDPATGFRRSA